VLERPVGTDLHKLPSWHGECVAIVAAGQSANTPDLALLKDRIHVVAINTSWELVPWADMLYACDVGWWQTTRGAPAFKGLKVTQDKLAKEGYADLIRIEVKGDEILTERLGMVGAGGNSGFQAVNLAAQLGAMGIALIGFDYQGDHWHGRHPVPCTNPDEHNFIKWRKALNKAQSKLAGMGIDVVNCSEHSSLIAYPKITIGQMLERWGL
jgi:hypothetical protein